MIDQTFSNKPLLIYTIQVSLNYFQVSPRWSPRLRNTKRGIKNVVSMRGEGREIFFNRYVNRDLEEFG